jgi:hypothetical protein
MRLTLASKEVNRVARQIFQILMSPKYFKLGFPNKDPSGDLVAFVQKRAFNSVNKFQPGNATQSVENVVAARMEFSVGFIENIAALTGELLESLLFNFNAPTGETEDGKLIQY